MARARRSAGNHSAIPLAAPGKAGDSLTPRAARAMKNCIVFRHAAWAMDAALQKIIASRNPSRVPMRSSSAPDRSCERA